MNAYVLAGGAQPGFAPEGKAYFQIQGKAMAEYVTSALTKTAGIDSVVVVGNHKRLIDNIAEALQQAQDSEQYILIATCDIPFITPEAVEDLISRANTGADLYYPIVEKRVHDTRFPGIRRTYVTLKEGVFTGGNLFVVRPKALFPLMDRLERLLELRKSPLSLSAELGFRVAISLLFSKFTGMLTIDRLQKRVEELFHIRAAAVISNYPEIANDIDRPEDLLLINGFMSG